MENQQHPIEGLMQTAMESLKSMVAVNTILGDPVETPDGTVIVPVSRVSFGFAAGGTEFDSEKEDGGQRQASGGRGEQGGAATNGYPFGGGSGAGISLSPVSFLVVGKNTVRMLPVSGNNLLYDRMIDLAPKVLEQLQGMLGRATKHSDGAYERTHSPR